MYDLKLPIALSVVCPTVTVEGSKLLHILPRIIIIHTQNVKFIHTRQLSLSSPDNNMFSLEAHLDKLNMLEKYGCCLTFILRDFFHAL